MYAYTCVSMCVCQSCPQSLQLWEEYYCRYSSQKLPTDATNSAQSTNELAHLRHLLQQVETQQQRMQAEMSPTDAHGSELGEQSVWGLTCRCLSDIHADLTRVIHESRTPIGRRHFLNLARVVYGGDVVATQMGCFERMRKRAYGRQLKGVSEEVARRVMGIVQQIQSDVPK